VEARMIVRRRGSHIYYTVCSQMSVRLSKDIPGTGRRGPYDCETSRLPHFLDSLLTDVGEVK
jgi:hypothetical protein